MTKIDTWSEKDRKREGKKQDEKGIREGKKDDEKGKREKQKERKIQKITETKTVKER